MKMSFWGSLLPVYMWDYTCGIFSWTEDPEAKWIILVALPTPSPQRLCHFPPTSSAWVSIFPKWCWTFGFLPVWQVKNGVCFLLWTRSNFFFLMLKANFFFVFSCEMSLDGPYPFSIGLLIFSVSSCTWETGPFSVIRVADFFFPVSH